MEEESHFWRCCRYKNLGFCWLESILHLLGWRFLNLLPEDSDWKRDFLSANRQKLARTWNSTTDNHFSMTPFCIQRLFLQHSCPLLSKEWEERMSLWGWVAGLMSGDRVKQLFCRTRTTVFQLSACSWVSGSYWYPTCCSACSKSWLVLAAPNMFLNLLPPMHLHSWVKTPGQNYSCYWADFPHWFSLCSWVYSVFPVCSWRVVVHVWCQFRL